MKTEFLQNFKVNDQPLPKEIIDAILAENGRDIEAAKKPFADYDALKDQLKTARDGLKAFEGVDVATLQGKITELQDQLKTKDSEWQKKMDDMAFNGEMADCITAAKGKNQKAIMAMLDDKLEEIRSSKDRKSVANAALETLKKEHDYLFDAPTPPPYACTYAKLALEYKATDPEMAKLFYNLSNGEINHMNLLHNSVVSHIENYKRTNGEPPEGMKYLYEYVHKRDMDRAEKVAALQGMFKK